MQNGKKDLTPIYLDKQGYVDFLASIDQLKERISNNNKERKAAFSAETRGEYISAEFEDIERLNLRLVTELQRRREMLSRVIIVDKEEVNDKVNIGNIVKIIVSSGNSEPEEKIFKIVGTMPIFDSKSEIREISINSPVGKAIYQRSVGETCTYSVNKTIFNVLIQEIINPNTLKNDKVKKLTK